MSRDTGALGLRSVIEEIMLDLPEMEDKGRYIVTDEVVKGVKPLFEKKIDKKSA